MSAPSIDATTPTCSGPTAGDRVRLGDTGLVARGRARLRRLRRRVQVRRRQGPARRHGPARGRRATRRARLRHHQRARRRLRPASTRPTSASRTGASSGIGKAGNPDVMAGVTPGMVVGVTTEAIAGEGLIVTAGGIDTHIHFICPQQVDEALACGVTTFVGGGTGPATGTNATTCTPGARHIRADAAGDRRAAASTSASPARATPSPPEGLVDQIRAGAIGLKLHEDWGTTPAAIDCCLGVADERGRAGHDPHRHAQRVGLRRRLDRRVQGPHDPHLPLRGRGRRPRAGHHPRLRRAERAPELDEPDAAVHRQHARRAPRHAHGLPPPRQDIPEDVAFAESRIRGETIAAEDILHDLGAISIISSDSQAMGRVGEVDHAHLADRATRCGSSAGACRSERGDNDNAAHQALRREVHDQPGDRARHVARDRLASRSASSPISCSGGRRSSASSRSSSSRAASSPGRRWATRTRRSRRRSRVLMRPMFGALGARGRRRRASRSSRSARRSRAASRELGLGKHARAGAAAAAASASAT